MTLPPSFADPEEYFEESVQFFQQYQYLYNFANTEILVRDILGNINVKELETIDVFDEDFDFDDLIEKDDFLKELFAKLRRILSVNEGIIDVEMADLGDIKAPLGPKKKHEIVNLARIIKDVCELSDCDTVVDLGSGLGYLDQIIFDTTNYNVLGLECNDSHYVGAKMRQRKYHKSSIEKVKYIKHTIDENSNGNIVEFLNDKFAKFNGFCISGLHACADLTIDAMNLFLKLNDAKALVVMPCCYHKMALRGDRFKNIPLSDRLKPIFEKYKGSKFMKIPFLRLAAQPPCLPEDNLRDSVFNLMARATLQLYAQRRNCILKRNKRKAVKTKALNNDFETYIVNACSGFTLQLENESPELTNTVEPYKVEACAVNKSLAFDLDELRSIWRQTTDLTVKAAIFILIQCRLQPAIENFILYDRLLLLTENGVKNCSFKKIFNEKLSPRCLALIAVK